MRPILQSILDNDLYKFTQQQAVREYAPIAKAEYKFINRRLEGKFTGDFLSHLKEQIKYMAELCLTEAESLSLHQLPYFKPQYLLYLKNYRYRPDQVQVDIDNNELNVAIKGPWHQTILWEVPLMALISQLYFEICEPNWSWGSDKQISNLQKKSDLMAADKLQTGSKPKFIDFGTRRRRSYVSQELVNSHLKGNDNFLGTSNLHFAHKFNLKPFGTMAHEWIMGVSALEGIEYANREAMRIWFDTYQGQLGTVLTDTFGTENFWKHFDAKFARLYDAIRQDSGDPIVFGRKAIARYKKLEINPLTKTIIFSDSLNPELVVKIHDTFCKSINMIFGIGTNLTNDVPDSRPLNMVIKLTHLNDIPVIKLSDDLSKATGDQDALRVAKWLFFKTPLDTE